MTSRYLEPRCSCQAPACVLWDGRYWCGFCAWILVGAEPAERFRELSSIGVAS